MKRSIIIWWIFIILISILFGCIVYTRLFDYKNNDRNTTEDNEQSTEKDDSTISNEENSTIINEGNVNSFKSCNSDVEYIYKVKVTNKNGAVVYDNYEEYYAQNVIETLDVGEEIYVKGDAVDRLNLEIPYDEFSDGYVEFDNFKDHYYYSIVTNDGPKYVKYQDVTVIESSIVTSAKFPETVKFYVHNDEYLYSGPGLSFEEKDDAKKISKGTIVEVDVCSIVPTALWLYVNVDGNSGWILEKIYHSVNYPYNEVKYGSAEKVIEETGEIYLEDESNLYKYAFSTDDIITKIAKGTKVTYDYRVDGLGIFYYHVNYNDNTGWISVLDQ